MPMCVRVFLLTAFGLPTLGGSASAQAVAPKTLVEVANFLTVGVVYRHQRPVAPRDQPRDETGGTT